MHFQSPRTFRMWRYGVGHSQLLLRALPENTESTDLDLHFEGVAAVQLGTRYVAPRLRLADRHERATLRTLAQTGAGPRHVAIAIESEAGTGLVLCRRVRVLRNVLGASGDTERSETLWSHPPGQFQDAPLTEAVWSELSGPVRAAIAQCDAERLELERSRVAQRLRPTITDAVYSVAHYVASWERLVRRLEPGREKSEDLYVISAYSNDLDSRDSLEQVMTALPAEAREGPLGRHLSALDVRFDAATVPDPERSLRPWVRPSKEKPESDLGEWWKRKPVREPWD
ncbi:hypothetical protein [Streptomyces sp. NPDC047525]|uniref:hypothetical protein n=1 Tax=Streptomyces sp. NPDC047525 TaxID=3155264 RepID=UPI003403CE17